MNDSNGGRIVAMKFNFYECINPIDVITQEYPNGAEGEFAFGSIFLHLPNVTSQLGFIHKGHRVRGRGHSIEEHNTSYSYIYLNEVFETKVFMPNVS